MSKLLLKHIQLYTGINGHAYDRKYLHLRAQNNALFSICVRTRLYRDTMMATGKYNRFERITIYCTANLCNYSVISLPALPLKQPVF